MIYDDYVKVNFKLETRQMRCQDSDPQVDLASWASHGAACTLR